MKQYIMYIILIHVPYIYTYKRMYYIDNSKNDPLQ